jgi:hypothetical protein
MPDRWHPSVHDQVRIKANGAIGTVVTTGQGSYYVVIYADGLPPDNDPLTGAKEGGDIYEIEELEPVE